MKIEFDHSLKAFHLQTSEMSYAFGIAPDGRLIHLYWGRKLNGMRSLTALAKARLIPYVDPDRVDEIDVMQYELPTREPFDFGDPVIWPRHSDGSRGLRLVYKNHRIEGDELTVTLYDHVHAIKVEMHYKGWDNLPLLSKWLTIENHGNDVLELQSIKSAAWHLPFGHEYRLTHFSGRWGEEYARNELMLTQSRVVLQNSRMTSAASNQVPFFILDENGSATETSGDLYFGMLQWSGNFDITVERIYSKYVCVTGGINPFDSNYQLKPGESFTPPAFVGGFANRGFEHMSETLYDWQLDHILPRGKLTDRAHGERPVIYNSWYPYEFNVTEEKCLALIEKCSDLGVELFVIDDGWMPGRVSDRKGLGDWFVDRERFPNGLEAISKACHDKGMLFGLWIEPEMVNPDSDLYRAHPEWIIHDPKRPISLQRNQMVLNLARDDVRDWMIETLDRVIEEYQLDYLKWDMNRHNSEYCWPDAVYEEQPSQAIRYMQNLYTVWQHMNEKFPDLLLENCAAGGGRSDFGMIPYADRINRSDNADPVDIMVLHEGFTMLFPPKLAGGAGNIAPAVHHIHGRHTPYQFRAHWGMTGSMSIGINLLKTMPEELEEIRQSIAQFKPFRKSLQDAYVYRIASARENPYAVFEYVQRDRKAFTLFAFGHGMRYSDIKMPSFRMRGLAMDAMYEDDNGLRMTGDALMNIGLELELKGDYCSLMWNWKVIPE